MAWWTGSGIRRTIPASHHQGVLEDTAHHAREDVGKIDDPRGQALMETTAEVLLGLKKAYEDYESKSEEAWRG